MVIAIPSQVQGSPQSRINLWTADSLMGSRISHSLFSGSRNFLPVHKDILIHSSFTYCPTSQGFLAFLSTTISVIELWIFICSVEGIVRFSSEELQTWWEILSARYSCEESQDDRHSLGMPKHLLSGHLALQKCWRCVQKSFTPFSGAFGIDVRYTLSPGGARTPVKQEPKVLWIAMMSGVLLWRTSSLAEGFAFDKVQGGEVAKEQWWCCSEQVW